MSTTLQVCIITIFQIKGMIQYFQEDLKKEGH